MKNEFAEQYKDIRWKIFKKLVFDSRAEFIPESLPHICETCGANDAKLHVHHKFYIEGRKIWEYGVWDVQIICEFCHIKGAKIFPECEAFQSRCNGEYLESFND